MNTLSKNDLLVVELEGALDSRTSADFKAWVEEKIIEGYRAIALDCQSLDFISSNGIAAILDIKRILDANQGAIALVHVSQEVKNLLGFLRILNLIPAYEDIESVTAFLSGYHKQPAMSLGEQQAAQTVTPETNENPQTAGIAITPELKPAAEEPSDLEPVLELPEPLRSKEPTSDTAANDGATNENTNTLPEEKKEEILLHKESTFNSTAAPEPAPLPQEHKNQAESVAPQPNVETVATSNKLPFDSLQTILCPNCSTALRVSRPGKYLCPACRYKFNWPLKS